jgi:PAS domain-containing protein
MGHLMVTSTAARYFIALLACASALGVALALNAWLQVTPFQFFLTAVLLSAYFGGTRPAILATVLGTLAISYYFEVPRYSLEITGMDTLVKLLVFLVTALLVSSVTERLRDAEARAREAQAAAEAARARLDGILARLRDGFFALDPEWRFTYASPQTAPMILSHRGPLTSEGLVGKTIWDVLPADASIRVAARLREAMATQQPVAFEEQDSLQGRWLAYRAFPTGDGLSVYCHDITQAKGAEATLQAMAQAAQGVSQVLDVALSPVAEYFARERDRRELPPEARAATDQMAEHLDRAMEAVWKLRRAVRVPPERASSPAPAARTELDG